ncbi:hypothetical protein ACFTAO_37105 [Paenibacillus rhizoplanae]
MGVDNSTVISANSSNPERSLMVIEKFMTDASYYNLMQYGIEGKHYVIEDGVKKQPQGFNEKNRRRRLLGLVAQKRQVRDS